MEDSLSMVSGSNLFVKRYFLLSSRSANLSGAMSNGCQVADEWPSREMAFAAAVAVVPLVEGLD